jgi:hypothetical protein
VVVDGKRLRMGIGLRTDERGADFPYRTFGDDKRSV